MRVLVGCVLALGASVPVLLAATPASASGCTASVSDAHPVQNETVTVSFVGPANTSATVVAHYHTVDNSSTTTTDANGHGSVGFDVGAAPYGETVVVNIVVGSSSCSTSFDPQAPGATTTTAASSSTTSTTAVLTVVASGSTTTTRGPTAVASVAAASTPTTSSLAFTGNATYVEAGAGALLVATGAFFLGSSRRRKELVRLLWPDER